MCGGCGQGEKCADVKIFRQWKEQGCVPSDVGREGSRLTPKILLWREGGGRGGAESVTFYS